MLRRLAPFFSLLAAFLLVGACNMAGGNGSGYDGLNTPVTRDPDQPMVPIQLEVPPLPYLENFDLSLLPANWQQFGGSWTLDSHNGALIQSSFVMEPGSIINGYDYALASFGDPNWSNYSVTARLKLGQADIDKNAPSAGVIGRYQNQYMYYYVDCTTALGANAGRQITGVRIIKVFKGADTVMSTYSARGLAVDPNSFELKAEFRAAFINVSLNGTQIMSVEDNGKFMGTPFLKGATGFRSHHQAFTVNSALIDVAP